MFTPFNYQQLKSLSYTNENTSSDDPDDPDDTKDDYIDDNLVRWMTEGTDPNMSPRSDCG